MNKDVAKSIEILFDLATTVEPRLKPLEHWFRELCTTIDKWYSSEGTQGIKRAKDILGQGWLSILDEETEQLDFVKTVNGIPELVIPLVDRVKPLKGTNGARLLSATLSLVRVTDLWLGIPTDKVIGKQLEVIQNSSLPESAHEIIDEFQRFVELFVAEYPDDPVVKAFHQTVNLTDDSMYYYRESKGPNGPLMANAHKDVKSLMEAQTTDGGTLLGAVVGLQRAITKVASDGWTVNTRFINAVRESDSYDELQYSSCPGKLNFIAEKSGKVRIIAQPDYFSQLALRPVHDWCFNVLRQFPADCTFDQRSAVPKICNWQNEGKFVASFDQSSCTDLFPFDLQLSILDCRFGKALTESVKTVMSDREWKITLPSKTTKKVRWSVGQPMGMLLSWPLMALTHHFLVQYAYWTSSGRTFSKKKGPFKDYVICGDDIVIASKSVADSYRKIVKSLGMRINVSKSHMSGQGTNIPPVSEFAKITVWKGHPLFAIRPNMVLSAVRDWRQAVPLLIDLASVEGFNMKLKHVQRLVVKHFPQGKRFLIPLLTIPREIGGVGYRDSESMKKKFELIKLGQVHPYILFLAYKIRAGLVLETRELTVQPLPEICNEGYYHCHPLVEYSNQVRKRESFSRNFWYQSATDIPSVKKIVKELLVDGIRPFIRFLDTDDDQTVLPFWSSKSEQEKLRDRTLWEKSLKHDFTLRPEEVADLIGRPFPYQGGLAAWTLIQREFTDRQYDTIFSVFGRARSN